MQIVGMLVGLHTEILVHEAEYVFICKYIHIYKQTSIYMVRRSPGPPPPPPWSMVQDATPLLPPVGGVWGPSSPVVWLWGFGVLGFA